MTDNLTGVALIAIGLIGIYFGVDYSSWAIFIGAVVLV